MKGILLFEYSIYISKPTQCTEELYGGGVEMAIFFYTLAEALTIVIHLYQIKYSYC